MKYLTIYGHIGFDAVKENGNGSSTEYLRFSVAVNEGKGEKQTVDWITVFTRQLSLLPYLKKGTAVIVLGRMRVKAFEHQATSSWKVGITLNAQTIQLAGNRQELTPAPAVVPEAPKEETIPETVPAKEPVDDLPF